MNFKVSDAVSVCVCTPHRFMAFEASPAVRPIPEAADRLRRARLRAQAVAERVLIPILQPKL